MGRKDRIVKRREGKKNKGWIPRTRKKEWRGERWSDGGREMHRLRKSNKDHPAVMESLGFSLKSLPRL